MLSALLKWLPLIAAITGVIGLVITALVANQLSNELGFPTLLPTIMGNFEVGYAMMVFFLTILIFSAPIAFFISDSDRELATFTRRNAQLFWGLSVISALALYGFTWLSPEHESYFLTGFLLLTCGLILPFSSNNPTLKSSAKTTIIGTYFLRGLLFLIFFCMVLISFLYPLPLP